MYIVFIVSDISLKLDALSYISDAKCLRLSLTTFTQCAPEAAEYGEFGRNNAKEEPFRRSRSFKVI